MFSLDGSVKYWLYNKPVDMRKSFNGLSGIVALMASNPLDLTILSPAATISSLENLACLGINQTIVM